MRYLTHKRRYKRGIAFIIFCTREGFNGSQVAQPLSQLCKQSCTRLPLCSLRLSFIFSNFILFPPPLLKFFCANKKLNIVSIFEFFIHQTNIFPIKKWLLFVRNHFCWYYILLPKAFCPQRTIIFISYYDMVKNFYTH